MNKTKIEWVKNPDGTQGYTWNPITGCLNGCEYCYARKLANGRLRTRYLENKNITLTELEGWSNIHSSTRYSDYGLLIGHPLGKPGFVLDTLPEKYQDPFYPRFWEDRMSCQFSYSRSRKAQGIFVCDMSDLFGIGIPEEWTKAIMDVIEDCPTDRFYLLTKQPQNLIKFSPFPDNCWVGVTATDSASAMIGMKYLISVKSKVKFMSFEPLLERTHFVADHLYYESLNWVVGDPGIVRKLREG